MCKSQRVATGRVQLECPKGTIFDTEKVQIGAISNAFTSFSWCNQEAIDKVLVEEGKKNCSAAMAQNVRQQFHKELTRKCKKKEKCIIGFDEKIYDRRP